MINQWRNFVFRQPILLVMYCNCINAIDNNNIPIYIYIHMDICMCVHIDVYNYVCTHTHIYIYISRKPAARLGEVIFANKVS